jgi:hypothetical protein
MARPSPSSRSTSAAAGPARPTAARCRSAPAARSRASMIHRGCWWCPPAAGPTPSSASPRAVLRCRRRRPGFVAASGVAMSPTSTSALGMLRSWPSRIMAVNHRQREHTQGEQQSVLGRGDREQLPGRRRRDGAGEGRQKQRGDERGCNAAAGAPDMLLRRRVVVVVHAPGIETEVDAVHRRPSGPRRDDVSDDVGAAVTGARAADIHVGQVWATGVALAWAVLAWAAQPVRSA